MTKLFIKGYRIISFILGPSHNEYKGKIYNLKENGKIAHIEDLIHSDIYSVERLYDKTILTVGDIMEDGYIVKFLYLDEDLFYIEKSRTGLNVLCWGSKAIKIKKL